MIIEQHILTMLEGIGDVDKSIIHSALKDAKIHVESDSISNTEPMFDILHKYYTMHILQLWGHIEDVTSEEVGDVKSIYAKTDVTAGETKWLIAYNRELAKIINL